MSVQALTWAINVRTGNPTAKAVLILLANRHNHDTGQCNPRISRLAADLECSERTVRRALDELETKGIISRGRAKLEDGRYGVYHYRLHLVQWTDCPVDQWTDSTLAPVDRLSTQEPEETLEPRKQGLGSAKTLLAPQKRKERPRDPLWDALVAELGEPATKSERGRRNKALVELREVQATAQDIHDRLRHYRKRWPGVEVTATALAANWTTLASSNGNGTVKLTQGERLRIFAQQREAELQEGSQA